MAGVSKSSLGVFSSLAGALIALFQAFIKGMSVVEDTVGMAEASVKLARKKQAIDLELDEVGYEAEAINRAALKHAKQEEELALYVGTDEKRQALLIKTKEFLKDRVTKRLAEVSSNVS